MTMQIRFYQAECGDAAQIKFLGLDGVSHNIFIDSGFERTYRHVLHDEIDATIKAKESIDLWVVSHIHDDHIGGTMSYIRAVTDGQLPEIVQQWLYNSPRETNENVSRSTKLSAVSSVKSISQGDDLQSYLSHHGKMPDSDILNTCNELDFFGMSVIILSPDTLSLSRLRTKYSNGSPIQRNEMDVVSSVKSRSENDYNKKLSEFRLDSWSQDDSLENASSIALLTRLNGKSVLWLADAMPGIVSTKLHAMGHSLTNQLKCDWVKVGHHGSSGNNSTELYGMINCQNYLFSANGMNNHNLPTKECMARILNARKSKDVHYNFFFTYRNELLDSIFSVDGSSVFKENNFSVHFPELDKRMLAFDLK